jgi:hypothetical protein
VSTNGNKAGGSTPEGKDAVASPDAVQEDAAKAALEERVAALHAENADLKEQLGALSRSLRTQKGQTTRAINRITAMKEAAKPRALGPLAAVFNEAQEAFTADDLMTAINSAQEIVLAFSDGKRELRGIPPVQVQADGFRLTRERVLFTDGPLELYGPGGEGDVSNVVGVALLLDGDQMGWSPLSQPFALGAGQRVNLAGSVIF